MPRSSMPSPMKKRHDSSVSSSASETFSLSGVSTMTPRRTVAPQVRDATLAALAHRTRRRIQWNRILRDANPSAAQWKWLENVRNFSIYSKQDADKEFAVLAIGVVQGSVPEVASLLVSTSQRDYVQKMEALYEKSFKHGKYVSDVTYGADHEQAIQDVHQQHDETEVQLSVRTATFDKPSGWLKSNDDWSYLDATSYNREKQQLEKILTSLPLEEATTALRESAGGGKHLGDVTAAYRIEPDQSETSEIPPGMEDSRGSHLADAQGKARSGTRVHFYAEHDSSQSSTSKRLSARFGRFSVAKTKSGASDKAVKQRLLYFARSCDRMSLLVRRRRLGMQIVVDQKRFLQAFSSSCFSCDKTLGVVAKVCRVCGQGVCSDCSAKYERETHMRSRGRAGGDDRIRLESIRVCDPCLSRVEVADYSAINDDALAGPFVQPNRPGAQPAAADLKHLLHDALLTAPSPQRKGAVMSVIRCLLDQENGATSPTTPSPMGSVDGKRAAFGKAPVLLTPVSGDHDYVDALDYLDVETVKHTEAEISAPEGRAYPLNTRSGSLEAQLAYPLPQNEAQRLDAIDTSQVLASGGTFDELNIICDIAAKEIGSFASLVSIITADEQRVIGANMDFLAELVLKREDAFCAHAIMDDKPLLVPHPESDIRFSKIVPVTALGARFYCGFPIYADDAQQTVVGSLCCIDKKPNELTESQYSVLRKLSEMASKVVRIEGEKRRRSLTSRSSQPQAPEPQTREL